MYRTPLGENGQCDCDKIQRTTNPEETHSTDDLACNGGRRSAVHNSGPEVWRRITFTAEWLVAVSTIADQARPRSIRLPIDAAKLKDAT